MVVFFLQRPPDSVCPSGVIRRSPDRRVDRPESGGVGATSRLRSLHDGVAPWRKGSADHGNDSGLDAGSGVTGEPLFPACPLAPANGRKQ